jgi:PAS domain S-box-containing protein
MESDLSALIDNREDRYRKLIEGLNVITYEYDLQDRCFIYVSKMAEVILGYPAEYWKQKGFWIDHLHPNDRNWALQFSRENTEKLKDHEYEYRMIAADGSVKWFKDITSVQSENGLPVTLQGVIIDITKRKNTEDELVQSKERYKALVEQQTEMITRWKPDGSFTYVNDVFCRFFGKRREELIGKKYIPEMPVEDLERFSTFFAKLDKNNPVGNFTHRVIMDDRSIRWLRWTDTAIFNEEGEIEEYQTVGRDITGRKKAEEALRDSEQQLLMIFDNAPIGMAITDLDKCFVKVNKAFCDIVGYTKDELLEKTLSEISHPDDRNIDDINFNKTFRENQSGIQFEKRYLRKDGKTVYAELHVTVLRDFSGKPFRQICQVVDFTERKESEQKLRLTQARLSTILNNLPNVAIYEYGQGINFVSENIVDILGYPAEEFMQDNLLFGNLIISEDLGNYDRKVAAWRKRGANGVLSNEVRVRNKKGEIVWLEDHMFEVVPESGKPYFSGIMIDITQQKIVHERIQETETRLSAILKNLPKVVVYQSGTDKEFISDNFENMTGYKPSEVLDQKYFFGSKIHPDDIGKVRQSLKDWHDRHEEGMLIMEFRLKKKDGSFIWIEDHMFKVTSNGDKSYLSGLLIDVTERKLAEQKISQSLEEKELLLKEIHHRVKNNLQVVSSLLKLQAGNATDEITQNILIDSQNRVRSMALVHQKLYQSKDLSQIDFSEYLKQLSDQLFNVFKDRNGLIDLDITTKELNLSIDLAIPCGLIINELISNSFKYAFPDNRKGSIKIDLKSVDNNDYLLIISDNGIGFPKDVDFKNTKSLGLQLVNTLVGQIDGSIAMQNHSGTTYTIRFAKREFKRRT